MKIFVAGTFDPMHVGHQWLLSQAAFLGDVVAVVASDAMVKKIRGRAAHAPEEVRAERVRAENLENMVVRVGRSDGDFLATLREAGPDILLLGFDQRADESAIRSAFPDLEIRRATAYFPEFFKSSRFRYTEKK